ncbi:Baseplate J-like protein [Roseovarius albus]|uniref:Baseplate J-like protein n=1 Tax=Roseovarius albus TaxID=1247867 RepID=A0A1X6ZRT1_9RHOB|nr:putative baseplate assembly protein [Roseovarius albus]SLN59714.1 Baseplate J-like protein [Roseovarius albus]
MTSSQRKPTPVEIDNRPGLREISARIGTHSAFYRSMQRGLADANRLGLADLGARENGDITLGLLDAWAAVLDTLTFYGERTANEAYLATATERRSIRDHARLIGYQLAPAKAAASFMAFVAEDKEAPDAPLEYDTGLQVRSIPRDGELPQLFETIEPLLAFHRWNALKPRLFSDQLLDANTTSLRLAASAEAVKLGDPVMFLRDGVPQAFTEAERDGFLRNIVKIDPKKGGDRLIELSANPTAPAPIEFILMAPVLSWVSGIAMTTDTLSWALGSGGWSTSALSTATQYTQTSYAVLTAAISKIDLTSAFAPIVPALMKVRAGCFGNTSVTQPAPLAVLIAPTGTGNVPPPGAITSTQAAVLDSEPPEGHVFVYLDREYTDIVAGTHVLVRDATHEGISPVHSVEPISVEAYGMSAKVTRIEINATLTGPNGTHAASSFSIRRTSIYAAPEMLDLAALPIEGDVGTTVDGIGADQVVLSTAEPELVAGKRIALTGERADLTGVMVSEILTLQDNTLQNGVSVLTFTRQPSFTYLRNTVSLSANVAEATHGETVQEILGDGDATRAFATFALKSIPLTHVAAKSETGMAPALEVRVNGVLWDLVDDFRNSGSEDRHYLLRISESGVASIIFGDGINGLRVPTGQDNIHASYRKGAGLDGMLEAGQLSLLATKPAGLKSVWNPLAPSGAADAEELEDARTNAPLKVLTLGRVVSLRDYEDFARGFAAVAKARADWTFDGFARPIFVTVAGQQGALLPDDGEDMANLRDALAAAGEADVRVTVRNYQPVTFTVKAGLFVNERHNADDVLEAAYAALASGFGFEARALGQNVSRAQVISVLQSVDGVDGVDLDALYRTGQAEFLHQRLGSARPQPSLDGVIPDPAELLTIDIAATRLEHTS